MTRRALSAHAEVGSALPHEQVWARLGLSRIHGIGVVAVRFIPEGTNVFATDRRELVWVDAAKVAKLGDADRLFYHDFGIRSGDRIGCPASFALLTVGWYVNEPAPGERANLAVLDDFEMVAARDIEAGEELTVRYASFSDPPSADEA